MSGLFFASVNIPIVEDCCSIFRTSPNHHDENGCRCCCWPDVTVCTDYRYVMHNLPAINYKLSCFTSDDTVQTAVL